MTQLGVRAVMLDLDGTLLDTAGDLTLAANRLLADIGLPAMSEAQVRTYIGRGIPNLVRRILTGAGKAPVDDAQWQSSVSLFREHYRAVNGSSARPYAGVVEGLARLREADVPLACVTNKSAEFTEPLLRETGLADYFRMVVSGDTLPHKKPHPHPLLHVCQAFGVAPERALLIGDSGNDIAAARAAGCAVFCVPYGYNEGVPVRAEECDALVPDLLEAARRLVPAASATISHDARPPA